MSVIRTSKFVGNIRECTRKTNVPAYPNSFPSPLIYEIFKDKLKILLLWC
jgi:hypothetical protein